MCMLLFQGTGAHEDLTGKMELTEGEGTCLWPMGLYLSLHAQSIIIIGRDLTVFKKSISTE